MELKKTKNLFEKKKMSLGQWLNLLWSKEQKYLSTIFEKKSLGQWSTYFFLFFNLGREKLFYCSQKDEKTSISVNNSLMINKLLKSCRGF
jgi:hypothetical protein